MSIRRNKRGGHAMCESIFIARNANSSSFSNFGTPEESNFVSSRLEFDQYSVKIEKLCNFKRRDYMIKSYPNEKIKKRPLANDQVKSDLKRFAKILITRFCRAEKLKKVRDPPLTQRSGARLFI